MPPVLTDVGLRGSVVIVTGGGGGMTTSALDCLDGGQVIDRE